MRKLLAGCLALCIPALLTAQTPADSISRTEAIDSVVVTARRPLMVYKQTGNIAVDIEQLKYAPLFAGEKDIFKFLQLLPGVSAGKDGMSGLLVRGGSNDQTLILYDDVPIYNQAHAYGILSIFSGETVQSAEVSKGFISPAYGSRLSALTQIRTREGDRLNHRQSLTVGTLSLAGTLDGPIKRDKGSYLISARYFFPEAVLAIADNDIRYGFNDITGKLTYDIHRNHTLSLGVYSGDDHMKNKEDHAENGFGWGNTTASLRLESRWNDNLRSSVVAYYTYLQNRQETEFKDDGFSNWGKTTFKTHEFGARMTFDQRLSRVWSLEYGATFSHQRFEPMHTKSIINGQHKDRGYSSELLVSGALFLNNRFQWGGWRADVGVRGAAYDNSEQTRYAVEPRAQLSYDFGRDNSVWLSGTINSQALVQFNRYYYSMPIDFWTPFRDGRLQHAWQVSLGGRAKLHENLTLSVEGYYKRMRNLPLIYDSDDFLLNNGGFIYGTGRAFGIEAMLQYQTERLSLTASYTYTDSRRRSDGVTYPFEYDVPHDFNAFVSYDVVKRPGRKHTFSLNVAWRSGLPYRLTNESYPDTDGNPIIGITAYPTMRMRNYFRADVSYNMERRKRNGVRNWQFSIINATWHKNPVSIYPYRGSYKATVLIPIMPSVSYTRTFGK
ncbi:TonB-dependent receptor plug domain-containing protein [Alistipes shahii]|jgi:outer membrane cobalamin receptor protein|uniref:Outer membrane cobalamin receptor protein n=4 Tax=Alistipes TaxID=239759 RepID=D4ILE0_9BACT|nr:TonB-dependent receptor plug domain-containing protein [Alistipes shahii]UWN68594.1 TonB-dependent receptor plug domain-containing protein [Alistipes shahii WAL 8301]CBK63752.1 Outer membrane cobalamin receptor protein [Alistipes shahii WAL 8301]